MNNKVNFLRGTSTEYATSTKDNDTFYYTTDDEKLYLGDKEITSDSVTIDNVLSNTSENPVQNKVINAALNNKADLSDIPTSLPANGGNADTVDGKHADDFISVTTGLNFSTSVKDYAETYKSGAVNIEFTWRGFGAPDAPYPDEDYFFHAYKGDNNWIRIVAFDVRHTASYEIAKANGSWGDWKKLSDGGNAASVGGKTITVTDVDPGAGAALNTGEIVFVTEVT